MIKMEIYRLLAMVCIIVFYTTMNGQLNTDVTTILNTAFKENKVQFMSEKNYQLGALDYKVPLIEKVEVRSETNDFDLSQQDFTIRVSPNKGSSRKAHRLYHESVKFMAKMELNTEIMKSLNDKYHLVKEYVFLKEQLRLSKVKEAVAKDKVKLLTKMVELPDFNIIDLIEAEDNVNKVQRTLEDLQNNLTAIEGMLNELLGGQVINIGLKDLIPISTIKHLYTIDALSTKKNHPEEEVLSAQHYNVMMEHEWEASKNNFAIGFIQASYGYDRDKSFGNNFSLGFGFDFPTKGSSGLELNEIKVNILDAQSRYIQRVQQLETSEVNARQRLENLLSMFELLSAQIKAGHAQQFHSLKLPFKSSI